MGLTPLVKGGQGRTIRDVRDSASALAWQIAMVAALIAVLLMVGGGA